jgi:hypothetical protein
VRIYYDTEDTEKETTDFVGVQRQKIKRISLGGVREGTNANVINGTCRKKGYLQLLSGFSIVNEKALLQCGSM